MAGLVEPVQHHPVAPGHRVQLLRSGMANRLHRGQPANGPDEVVKTGVDGLHIDRLAGKLELQHRARIGSLMSLVSHYLKVLYFVGPGQVEADQQAAGGAQRLGVALRYQPAPSLLTQNLFQGLTEQLLYRNSQIIGSRSTGDRDQALVVKRQQKSMRLNASGNMDRFAVAQGQGRHGDGRGSELRGSGLFKKRH